VGLLSRIVNAFLGNQNEERASLRAILESGPVIISTTGKFHRGEYRGTRSEWIYPKCPNPDPEYIPSIRRRGICNETAEQAVKINRPPCSFCYSVSLESLQKALASLDHERQLSKDAREEAEAAKKEAESARFTELQRRGQQRRNHDVVPENSQVRETWE
jgi:hypothetical protein